MVQCKAFRSSGNRCPHEAIDGDWCSAHAPIAPPADHKAAPRHEPDPATVAGVWADEPPDPLALVEARLARLRDERDRAEEEAAAALARSNRVARELIATARERQALLASALHSPQSAQVDRPTA